MRRTGDMIRFRRNRLRVPLPLRAATLLTVTIACGDGVTGELDPADATSPTGPRQPGPVDCSAPRLDFGTVRFGTTARREVVCRNDRDEVLAATFHDRKPRTGPFAIARSIVMVVLHPGDRLRIPVEYAPRRETQHRGELFIELVGHATQISHRIELVGQAVGPTIEVTPAQINFGLVSLLAPSRRSVVVTNTGTERLEVTDVRVEPDETVFSLFESARRFALEPGGMQVIDVEFAPPDRAPHEAELVIESDAFGLPRAIVRLRGEDMSENWCSYAVEPRALDFGVVAIGETATRTFAVRSLAPSVCLVSDVGLTDDTDPPFAVVDPPASPRVLAPEEELTVTVHARPTTPGVRTGAVRFGISSGDAPYAEVPLTVTAR
jgi:hypothetical protein